MARPWAMRLLETPSAARRTMPARLRTRAGISTEAATASRMTCSADEGAGCHTDNSIVRSAGSSESGLAWRLSMAGGCFSARRHQRPWCRYLHYREDRVKMVERGAESEGRWCGGPWPAIHDYKTSKPGSLCHFAETGGERQAVERDTWSRYRSLNGAFICTMRSRRPLRAARRARKGGGLGGFAGSDQGQEDQEEGRKDGPRSSSITGVTASLDVGTTRKPDEARPTATQSLRRQMAGRQHSHDPRGHQYGIGLPRPAGMR